MTTLPNRSRERRFLIFYLIAAAIFIFVLGRQFLQSATVPTAPAAVESSTATGIDAIQARIAQNPDNPDGYAQLGLAYLQQVRETGDAALYIQAEQSLNEALALNPDHVDALMGQGILALARHDFTAALEWGERARELNPFRAQIVGILVDAYVELGQYEQAIATAQEMVDLRPDLASYSRVSYIRELHGDTEGAIAAMETAVSAGAPGTEQTAWTQVQLGNLYLNSGQFATAERIYDETLFQRPNYAFAIAGLAEVAAAQGDYDKAIQLLQPLVERLPLPEFTILLGDMYTLVGNEEAAAQQYELVAVIQQLNNQAGMNTELEMALFEADFGNPQQALSMAQAAYDQRPSIHAAESLAWAHYRVGNLTEAQQYIEESMRLGTQDAHLYYRASIIAEALGETAVSQQHKTTAQAITPAQHLALLFSE